MTRPAQGKDVPWLGYQAKWLANVIWARAPERLIWESALKKAEDRASEVLPPKKTPSERYEDRTRRLKEISASPARRRQEYYSVVS